MSSYALHLANLAEAQGIDLAASSVRIVLTSAEQLTAAKRTKLERAWGARVHDSFGMTEATMMAAEADGTEGLRVWTDMFLLEVVDEATGQPLPDGETGALVVTPLWTNHVTPFLRWLSGDVVSLHHPEPDGRPFSVFPVLRHAHRTSGFFKVRGVNVNHTEFEDFMFRQAAVVDFRAELYTRDGLEGLRVLIELPRDAEPAVTAAAVAASVKRTFEVTPEVRVLERGTLAREFEKSVKAARFVDARG
jgi:phenylacetate-CoA ligase